MSTPSMGMSSLLNTTSSSKLAGNQVILKPGQILTGKVLEIFPNQKASVQLGNQQFTAQLQASLNVHSNYWFQVQSVNQLLHLKVLADKPSKQTPESQATALLEELKLPLTKENIAFIKSLIESETPFRSNELRKALQMQQGKGNNASQAVLKAMIRHQLPITPSIYNALVQVDGEPLEAQLQQLQTVLTQLGNSRETSTPLLARIHSLLSDSTPQGNIHHFISNEVKNGDQVLIDLLKTSGIVSKDTSSTATNNILDQLGNSSEATTLAKLQTLFQRQLPFTNQQTYQFSKIMQSLSSVSDTTKIDQQLKALQAFLEEPHVAPKIAEALPNQAKAQFQAWQQQPASNKLESMLVHFKELVDQQIPKNTENKLIDILATFTKGSSVLSPKEQFLLHVKQFLSFSGIDYENRILHADKNISQQFSLKQLVLQAIQSGQTGQKEMESLLSTLNGLQLSSVQETEAFIQASIQVPGLFGAKENIQIDFESKKEKSGQVNPDYCRVVFYLELKNMGDTMIDMSIQKRVINITIYNEHQEIIPLLEQIRPVLEQGLEKGDYNLSGVQYKQLSTSVDEYMPKKKQAHDNLQQGVDIRI
ncbi:hypothetical protein GCM10011351_03920 [Paraliobacillus quinghaiensis]|uniref:Flagellar hook-length control protein-like C-terminal domain-containing protein n=1 Tax=Paraliobacillus quinghaiensis TaxID=470815 RepID=A0A917TG95_9BACI|nr:hypothetical protein [Paraliobacillus quinghaiensis]GGM21292.1 hypothetical protein GCM10011351_03920 [Paraliobacillus quinghaiensis]